MVTIVKKNECNSEGAERRSTFADRQV